MRLPGAAQIALDMSYRQRLTQPQIAVEMTLSERAVKKLISTALQDLARIILAAPPSSFAAPGA